MANTLYYGDNLPVMRRYIGDETVDLVYLDPPFNSNANYNILFTEKNGAKSQAQGEAFKDTWIWGPEAAECYQQVVESGGSPADAMVAFRKLLGDNAMMAYLANMAPRLSEIRRVLKATGSVYLHCDPTASHYLKVLMDAVFGSVSFRNELIWRRSNPHGNVSRGYGGIHDVILFYSKTDKHIWTKPHKPYFLAGGQLDPAVAEQVHSQYAHVEPGTQRRFQATSLLNPNPDRPNLTYEFHGHTRVWRWTRSRMEEAERQGRLWFPKKEGGMPREKRYLDEQEGYPLQDLWDDIPAISPRAAERLGYPTQKPEALLERILLTSSKEGDLVLHPFCGCGTTVSVAQRLERRWIGIDITHAALTLMKYRLERSFGAALKYDVIGEPTTVADAQALAESEPYQFQWWALGRVGAEPRERKKGADRGVDGRAYFTVGEQTREIIFSVKAGGITPGHVRDLAHVVDREDAQIGVLITMRTPTQPMISAAASAGWYTEELTGERYPKVQFLSVADLIEKKQIERPYASQPTSTFKAAPRVKPKKPKQYPLDGEGADG